ncbi:TPA: hypothetical protein ACH3X2_009841 [Trebouxia sp. C0005]
MLKGHMDHIQAHADPTGANQEQAFQQLRNACQKTLTIVKPVSQASKERDFWPALHRFAAVLRVTLRSVPDGTVLLDQIFDSLKPGTRFEDSAKFASDSDEFYRLNFWEMVVCHIEAIEEELARVHA